MINETQFEVVYIITRKKLSIIIPVYNVEKHLRSCLDSLIDGVDHESYEIILIDDGSSDDSGIICDEYSNKYDSIIVSHSNNLGAASARNIGLDLANGKYITFVDSDDYVEKGYIKFLSKLLDEHVDDDIVSLPYYIDYTQSGVLNEVRYPLLNSGTVQEAVRLLDAVGAINLLWNKLYKRHLINCEPKTEFLVDSEPGEDLIFNIECFIKAKRVSLVNEGFYHWVRRGEDTLANKYRENLIEKNKVFIEYRNKLYSSLNMEETDAALLSQGNINYVFSCIPNMYRVGKKFPRKKRVSFYKEIIESESVAYWISKLNDKSTLIKQFVMIYKTHSPIIMDSFYSVIMGMRNSFGNIWNKL